MGNCLGLHSARSSRRCVQQQYSTLRTYKEFTEPNLTPEGNPLPPVVHRVIKQKDLAPGRLVLVGDVHGCLIELFQLLDTVGFQYGKDNLILVGDLVNKGPRSQEVAAAARVLCQNDHTWAARGNNDDSALAAWWRLQQGIIPPEPKHAWVGELLPEDVDFLMQLPFSLTVEGYGLIVVHGGLVPNVPLEQQDLALVSALRDILQQPDGSFIGLERAEEGSLPWAPFWQGPQHVIFGHDSVRRLQTAPCATGIDSGCCYGGQLTACVLPPLKQLQHNAAFVAANRAGKTPSLFDMGAVIVSVPSGQSYDDGST